MRCKVNKLNHSSSSRTFRIWAQWTAPSIATPYQIVSIHLSLEMTIFIHKDSIISQKKFPKYKINSRTVIKAQKKVCQELILQLISQQKAVICLRLTCLEKICKSQMKKLIKPMSAFKHWRKILKNLKPLTA